jgi:hypothetical protein
MPGRTSDTGSQDDRRSCLSMMVVLPVADCAATPDSSRTPSLAPIARAAPASATGIILTLGIGPGTRASGSAVGYGRWASDLRTISACSEPCANSHTRTACFTMPVPLGSICPAPSATSPRLYYQLCGECRADANTCSCAELAVVYAVVRGLRPRVTAANDELMCITAPDDG